LIDSSAAVGEGDELILDVRGRPSTVVVTKPPFVESHVR
jgi:aminomethyltransferase